MICICGLAGCGWSESFKPLKTHPCFVSGAFCPLQAACALRLLDPTHRLEAELRTEEPRRATSPNVATQAAHWVSWMPPRRVRTAASRVRVSRCQTIPGDVNFAKTRPPPKTYQKNKVQKGWYQSQSIIFLSLTLILSTGTKPVVPEIPRWFLCFEIIKKTKNLNLGILCSQRGWQLVSEWFPRQKLTYFLVLKCIMFETSALPTWK